MCHLFLAAQLWARSEPNNAYPRSEVVFFFLALASWCANLGKTTQTNSFPCSAWECRLRRSASSLRACRVRNGPVITSRSRGRRIPCATGNASGTQEESRRLFPACSQAQTPRLRDRTNPNFESPSLRPVAKRSHRGLEKPGKMRRLRKRPGHPIERPAPRPNELS